MLEYIPNALGCETAGVSTLTWIIPIKRNTLSDAGMSMEYIWSCPSGRCCLNIFQCTQISNHWTWLICIILVQMDTLFDVGIGCNGWMVALVAFSDLKNFFPLSIWLECIKVLLNQNISYFHAIYSTRHANTFQIWRYFCLYLNYLKSWPLSGSFIICSMEKENCILSQLHSQAAT